jgi:signal transduction histidine kinase
MPTAATTNRLPAGSYDSRPRVAGFRLKLLVAMMLVVGVITGLALYFAQRRLATTVAQELERAFQTELDALHNAREVRLAAFGERCLALGRRARLSAAPEEGALDLLYPNAEFELRDLVENEAGAVNPRTAPLRAEFYRFLDRRGTVIPPPKAGAVGHLSAAETAQLVLPRLPVRDQIGYIEREAADGGAAGIAEVIASPIVSTETGEVISALELGFRPFEFGGHAGGAAMKSGIWFHDRLHSVNLPVTAAPQLAAAVLPALDAAVPITLEGEPHLLISKRLNPDSLFPPAYEICAFPLGELMARQRQLRWQVLGAGAVLLLLGLAASHVVSRRLSAPVEKLAVDSERSARFSADASHQLKTPVTVLRAGLEELLTRENLTPEECDQVSALIHQTYRLSSLIEDLLLLSRMDAGRLKLALGPVNLTQLIEAALDDLGATTDELNVRVETDFPADLYISGEKRYTAIILQNLLENARKYNRAGGRVRVAAHVADETVTVDVGNTGRSIAPAAQAHVFERFHRGAMGENVPGYGLGLNLARELARLHEGELQLVRSADDWTEFQIRFRRIAPGPDATKR